MEEEEEAREQERQQRNARLAVAKGILRRSSSDGYSSYNDLSADENARNNVDLSSSAELHKKQQKEEGKGTGAGNGKKGKKKKPSAA